MQLLQDAAVFEKMISYANLFFGKKSHGTLKKFNEELVNKKGGTK